LCMNRPEGFSLSSTISDGLPTQCLFDAVLVPLPAWIYFAALLLCAVIFPSALSSQRTPPPRRWVQKTFVVAYYFCIGVIVLMESVEIGRLAAASLGVGLVPFIYVGCAVACALQATDGLWGHAKGFQVAGALFWALSLCITSVKLAAVVRFGVTGPLARLDTAYPISDQVTDLAVELPFYALLVALEVSLVF
ncbi:hypothetical protein GQ53DRAFT_606715, partial [Thozetella sp. PMI_491]